MSAKFLWCAAIVSIAAAIPVVPARAQCAPPQPVYTYDDQGRIILATYPNGAQIAYTYDANGNLQTVVQVTSPSSQNSQAGQSQ